MTVCEGDKDAVIMYASCKHKDCHHHLGTCMNPLPVQGNRDATWGLLNYIRLTAISRQSLTTPASVSPRTTGKGSPHTPKIEVLSRTATCALQIMGIYVGLYTS